MLVFKKCVYLRLENSVGFQKCVYLRLENSVGFQKMCLSEIGKYSWLFFLMLYILVFIDLFIKHIISTVAIVIVSCNLFDIFSFTCHFMYYALYTVM